MAINAPDTVAGALRDQGRWSLDEPPRRFDAEDWWFRAEFTPPPQPSEGRCSLAFGGLAGECDVWLNGIPLLASDNMHVAHDCAVPMLLEGDNQLLMRFASLDARLAARRPRPRWRSPMVAHQQLRWARVSLLGRTPGWSPPAPAIGPWRSISWFERDRIELSDLRMATAVEDGTGRLRVSFRLAEIGGSPGAIDAVTLRVRRDALEFAVLAERSTGTESHFAATLSVADAILWWPHTHGEPALYKAEIIIAFADALEEVTVDLGQIGFRTLTVDTAEGDFSIAVNGVPIFCRGSNWTPLDMVSPAASPQATYAAVAEAQAAGLNMLRVNGCMVYEDDSFFDACDVLGVLVWQDFMFANMDYPAEDDAFVSNVTNEAVQQLARWQAHPSLAIICGNSEGEQQAAMWGAPRDAWTQPLFDERLAALAQEYCADVHYWPSSSSGGSFPHQNDFGTTSYYGVGAYLRPLDDARRANPRFASECLAFANIPSRATISRIPRDGTLQSHHPAWKSRVPRDLGAGWDFDDVRDHYLRLLYGVDPVALRSVDHDRYLQLSRAVSAEVIEAIISEWRRPSSACRGALLWFHRDLWAGAGWGMLDERGLPKAAFHGLRRACLPIHLFITDEGTNGLYLHVVNDPGEQIRAAVEVSLYRRDGLRVRESSRAISVPAHGGRSWAMGEWFNDFVDTARSYRFGPSENALVAATLRDDQQRVVDRAFFFPEGLSAMQDLDVGLSIVGIEKVPGGGLSISVSTDRPAQSVHFDADGHIAQDDYFHLAPGEVRTVCLSRSDAEERAPGRVTVAALNAWSSATIGIPR